MSDYRKVPCPSCTYPGQERPCRRCVVTIGAKGERFMSLDDCCFPELLRAMKAGPSRKVGPRRRATS